MNEINSIEDFKEVIETVFLPEYFKQYEDDFEEEIQNFDFNNGDKIAEMIPWKEKVLFVDGYSLSVEDEFGGEGEGDSYWFVFKLVLPNEKEYYVKYNGYYNSWDGTSWDSYEPELVEPYEKTVRDWRSI